MISIDRDTDTDDAHILYPYIEVKKKSVVVQTHTELEATTPDTPVLEIDDVTNDAPVPHPYDSSYGKSLLWYKHIKDSALYYQEELLSIVTTKNLNMKEDNLILPLYQLVMSQHFSM